jgi:salicylate hydroxylase
MSSSCKIAIVGGGLAGLAAAHALQTFGMKAEVFETAPALGEIGAAVNVSPQAVKALQAIGVGDQVAAVGNTSPGIYTRNMQTGEFLELNDRHKAAARYGAPYYTFHRADLLDALASGLDHGAIHLDHRLTGLAERSDGILLAFANGTEVEAEIVIGADGVRSVIRQALYGEDSSWRIALSVFGSARRRCSGS